MIYSVLFISVTQNLPLALRHTIESETELAVYLAFINVIHSYLCFQH
jgi:hypothetical protein